MAARHPTDPRKEHPHPGAQLQLTDTDSHRITGFLTDSTDGVIPDQLTGLELRHRQHAQVEDRICPPRPLACITCPSTPLSPTQQRI